LAEEVEKGVFVEPNHTTAEKSLVLDKSFNTLCPELIASWLRLVLRNFRAEFVGVVI
jgi:hypothetical protein